MCKYLEDEETSEENNETTVVADTHVEVNLCSDDTT